MAWLGRDDAKDYEFQSRDYVRPADNARLIDSWIIHKPSGVIMRRPSHRDNRDGFRYFHLSDGADFTWQVEFEGVKRGFRNGQRWELDTFKEVRAKYGENFRVFRSKTLLETTPVPWSLELVKIAAQLMLIYLDISAWFDNKPPSPDCLDFSPPELPTELHFKMINFVPGASE